MGTSERTGQRKSGKLPPCKQTKLPYCVQTRFFTHVIFHTLLLIKWKWSRSVVPDSLLIPRAVVCTSLLHLWDFPGKNTGEGCHFLLQEIFPMQGSNPGLPPCRQMLYPLSHQGRLLLINAVSITQPWSVCWTLYSKSQGPRFPFKPSHHQSQDEFWRCI